MALVLPEPVVDLLHKNLGNFLESTADLERLRKQAKKLSADLAQKKFSESVNEPAYFAYNFPVNFMKGYVTARSIIERSEKFTNRLAELDVWDLGCGEGAGMLGMYYALSDHGKIRLTGIDKSIKMIKHCRLVMKSIKARDPSINYRLVKADVLQYISKIPQQHFDMIIIANSLLELYPDKIPLNFIKKLINLLKKDGIIIFIEPALKTSFHRLAQLRSQFIEKLNAHIILPCLHEQYCPLATIPGEWCHQSVKWQPPEYLELLNKGLNREIDVLKEKGKIKCYLCTPG